MRIITLNGGTGQERFKVAELFKRELNNNGMKTLVVTYGQISECVGDKLVGRGEDVEALRIAFSEEVSGSIGHGENYWTRVIDEVFKSLTMEYTFVIITDALNIDELRLWDIRETTKISIEDISSKGNKNLDKIYDGLIYNDGTEENLNSEVINILNKLHMYLGNKNNM